MDHFRKLHRQVQTYIFIVLAACTTMVIAGGWFARQHYASYDNQITIAMWAISMALILVLSLILTEYTLKPLGLIWRAVLHVSPGHSSMRPPNLEKNKVGHDLVTSLALQVYQLASTAGASPDATNEKISALAQTVADTLPIPIYVVGPDETIIFANELGVHYLGRDASEIVGNNLYSVIDLLFQDNNTLDTWLSSCRGNKVTANATWNHVRLKLADQTTVRQFDLAAHYSKDNSTGAELILALFDQSDRYNSDDQALSFIAMAVHELRTPLTMLRGYIEVFEDELGDTLDEEMTGFMHKMHVSSQQLTAFVGNILNVARFENNQLTLHLGEADWKETLTSIVDDLTLRAQVHGKTLKLHIDDNLPSVGIDKVSMYELVSNLVDNAIKYSGSGTEITIRSYLGKEGTVETTVQDNGVGIPSTALPHLFEKFERSHRTRAQIGGTGLGLYLCKILIDAHGGNIWVKSTEGKGSTFGFTISPYAQLADGLKNSNNKDIMRTAHGWIKNHSLYRR